MDCGGDTHNGQLYSDLTAPERCQQNTKQGLSIVFFSDKTCKVAAYVRTIQIYLLNYNYRFAP